MVCNVVLITVSTCIPQDFTTAASWTSFLWAFIISNLCLSMSAGYVGCICACIHTHSSRSHELNTFSRKTKKILQKPASRYTFCSSLCSCFCQIGIHFSPRSTAITTTPSLLPFSIPAITQIRAVHQILEIQFCCICNNRVSYSK